MGERLINLYYFLSGGIMVASWVAGLCFFRFWHRSGDRFFLYFGIAFLFFGAERVALMTSGDPNGESTAVLYLMRLSGFLLILWGIFEKNLRRAS
jgi:hypothetical protein